MNNGYEYYYLLGLDIPLKEYGLGIIKQPKIVDFLRKDIAIDNFYFPFVMNDIILGQSRDVDSVLKVKESLGDLTFLLMNCIQANRIDVIDLLKEDLMFLYQVDNINITDKLTIKVGDCEIDNSNFNILCNVILEMLKIDKSKMKFDLSVKKEMTAIEKEFERRRLEYEKRVGKNKKNQDLTTLDIMNIVIHSSSFKYEDVSNMTLYQLKNSFDVLIKKDTYNTTLMYMVSPKFDIKEKQEHWIEKIKMDKSTLNQND